MKRRIRYMALLLVLCMLALTGCAQPRDTMTLRVCLDAAPGHPGPRHGLLRCRAHGGGLSV